MCVVLGGSRDKEFATVSNLVERICLPRASNFREFNS